MTLDEDNNTTTWPVILTALALALILGPWALLRWRR